MLPECGGEKSRAIQSLVTLVPFPGTQWSEACQDIPAKVHLAPPPPRKMFCRLLWILKAAYTTALRNHSSQFIRHTGRLPVLSKVRAREDSLADPRVRGHQFARSSYPSGRKAGGSDGAGRICGRILCGYLASPTGELPLRALQL